MFLPPPLSPSQALFAICLRLKPAICEQAQLEETQYSTGLRGGGLQDIPSHHINHTRYVNTVTLFVCSDSRPSSAMVFE
jgi:hypothetical protein